MARFQAPQLDGLAVQELEVLVRTAVFKSANQVIELRLQPAADRIDAAYPPKPGGQRQARAPLTVDGSFGCFTLPRDDDDHPGQRQGHSPADATLGLEGGCPPALARLICLEGADEASCQKAQPHLKATGGIAVAARQIQRLIQTIGPGTQSWPEREALVPGTQRTPILYPSGDASGVPRRPEELAGRKGKGPDGKAKTRWAGQLLRDKVEYLIATARKECAGTARAEAVAKELGYFVRNLKRRPDGPFRSRSFSSVRG
jgi:hypothetical protein